MMSISRAGVKCDILLTRSRLGQNRPNERPLTSTLSLCAVAWDCNLLFE